jgi:acetyltransferase-like isoleucine patch superfamily enzyme
MLRHIKEFYWELKDEIGRFNHVNAILKGIPGAIGMKIRAHVIPQYFFSCGQGIIIHENVRYRSVHKLTVGNNVELGVDNFIQASGGVTLEDNVMLGPGVKIWSANHKFEDLAIPIREQGYEYEPVIIGKGTWLGANVFVMPGVTLPEGCVVSAGSVVGKKKYLPFSILAGNPCRAIASRRPEDNK